MLKHLVRIVTLALVLPLAVGTLYVSAQGLPQTPNASAKAGQGGLTAGGVTPARGRFGTRTVSHNLAVAGVWFDNVYRVHRGR